MIVIGQGTAAIAAQSLAYFLASFADDHPLIVEAQAATELSGFGMRTDMSDTLVVAISQSGTTTDTNRTVDLARGRGASRRRHRQPSQQRPHRQGRRRPVHERRARRRDGGAVDQGVLRAGRRRLPPRRRHRRGRRGLRRSVARRVAHRPASTARRRWQSVLERRADIGRIAAEVAPPRRSWALVGNGPNRIAAQELRIKLSELCYKSIACDVTEDKKHIDLSAEPLILVCAAGLSGSTADDVAKEVAIYRAHKAAPVVIATEGEDRFGAAAAGDPRARRRTRRWRSCSRRWRATCSATKRRSPSTPRRSRCARAEPPSSGRRRTATARPLTMCCATSDNGLADPRHRFFDGLRGGQYDGHLEASTAARLSSLLRYALGTVPLDAFQAEHGKVGTPGVVVDDLTAALTRGIEELTRPIDAIKHQAKTVTVGISRTDETLLQVPLVAAVIDAGAPRDSLSYRTLRTLAGLDPAVAEVTGWIRYRVEGDVNVDGAAIAVVVDRGGIAREIPSRHRARSGAARHQAHGCGRARGVRRSRPPRRSDRRHRARGEGRHLHRDHAAARAPRRRSLADVGAQRPAELPRPLRRTPRRGHRDRARLP